MVLGLMGVGVCGGGWGKRSASCVALEYTLVDHVVGLALDGVAGLRVLLHVLDEIHDVVVWWLSGSRLTCCYARVDNFVYVLA